jgi:hypothetical protein
VPHAITPDATCSTAARRSRRGDEEAPPVETRRRVGGAGSAATSPRPAAAPRHEVRGEQRGEVGDGAAVPCGVRRRGWRRRRRRWEREGEGVGLGFCWVGGGCLYRRHRLMGRRLV